MSTLAIIATTAAVFLALVAAFALVDAVNRVASELAHRNLRDERDRDERDQLARELRAGGDR